MSARSVIATVSGIGTLALSLWALALPTAFISQTPGPIFNTIATDDGESEPTISVSGIETYPTDGTLSLTTVLVSGIPGTHYSVPQALRDWASQEADISPREQTYPSGITGEEIAEQNTSAMVSSQDLSLAAALNYLDIPYGVEITVSEFTEEARAAGADDALEIGDVVIGADGQKITGVQALRNIVNEAGAEPIELEVIRDGERVTVDVPTYQDVDEEYYVGLLLQSRFDFPVEADIALEDVGGPSAGLMFSLGLVDTMTEGSLTGGLDWAGTGTVDPDGTVGPIGGIAQKVVGAAEGIGESPASPAEHFLAPRENCAGLQGRIPDDLEVYGVDDVEQAVEIVEAVRDDRTDFLAGLEPCGR